MRTPTNSTTNKEEEVIVTCLKTQMKMQRTRSPLNSSSNTNNKTDSISSTGKERNLPACSLKKVPTTVLKWNIWNRATGIWCLRKCPEKVTCTLSSNKCLRCHSSHLTPLSRRHLFNQRSNLSQQSYFLRLILLFLPSLIKVILTLTYLK